MHKIELELFNTFNKIKFDDNTHTYYLGDKILTSVTTVIHNYCSFFDEKYWLGIKSAEYGISETQLKYSWEFLNDLSTFKGSALHNFIEFYYFNKLYPYPKNDIINHFGYDPIIKEFEIIRNQFFKFYEISFGKLIPIKPEFIVYDEEYMISGMTDMLFYNLKKKCLQIYDWKTNKQLRSFNNFQKMSGIFSDYDDCELNVYTIQLNTYKYIIEKNTNIKIDGMYIVWFFEKNKSFEIIEIKNIQDRIKFMFDDIKK